MDVVITGSSGLIGSALVEALTQAGHRPIRLVRGTATGQSIGWDPEAGTVDSAGLEGVDAVVHLAGESIAGRRWSAEQKRRILESRTKGTDLLATTLASLTRPPGVLVSSSGINYYGDRGDEPVTEDAPPGSGFLTDVTVAWEGATAPAAEAGIRVACARTGIVLSPKGGALATALPIFKLGLGGRLGSGRQYWSWISLDDQVAALIWLLEHEIDGPVNLTAPEPVTNREFTKALGKVLGRPTVVPVPSFGPKLLLGSQAADELVFSSIRVVPRKLLDSGFAFSHPDVTSALRAVLGR